MANTCPKCGSKPTQFVHPFACSVQLPFDCQMCGSNDCGLPCKFWQEFAALQSRVEKLERLLRRSEKRKYCLGCGAIRFAEKHGQGCPYASLMQPKMHNVFGYGFDQYHDDYPDDFE